MVSDEIRQQNRAVLIFIISLSRPLAASSLTLLVSSLSGSAEARTGRLHHFGVGHIGQQSQGQVLQINARRPQTARPGNSEMGDNNRDPGALLRSVGGVVMNVRQLRGWLMRLSGLFHGARREREFAEELESHLAMHIEDNLGAGMSPEEARRQALIKLGGVRLTKERYREQRGLPMLETLLQDLRFGLRMLRKNPGFTFIAALSLALGIGANTAIFSLINAIMLHQMPVERPDQLVEFIQRRPGEERNGDYEECTDDEDFRDYK